MSTDFILPDIGEGIVECEIVEWVVQEGDSIQEDQVVVEVMTDKAVVEIPAKFDGTVTKLYYAKGDIAKVGEPLFAIDAEGSASAPAETETKPQTKEPAPTPEKAASNDQASTSSSDFILPDIGEGIVECEIVEWKVSQGDTVEEDQVVVEVMTDKAVVEIPAKSDGTIGKLYYAKGDIARVGEPLFSLVSEGGEASSSEPQNDAPAQPATAEQVSTRAEGGEFEPPQPAAPGKVLASPAVRRLAREKDIDLTQVQGSGKKGRILKEDVKSGGAAQEVKSSGTQSSAPAKMSTSGGTRTEPMRGVRAAMAKQMAESVRTIPHFTYAEEFDLTELRKLHAKLKAQYAEQGIRLTLMPFFIKALSLAMSEFPIMNAQLNDDATEITYYDDHNIGMAVATKVGLMVPNIKGVQNMSLLEVAEEVNRLTASAREGKVAQADMKGGTITISNIGVVGGTVTTPIINKPEAAIVALGKVQTLPRFADDGSVVGRDMMTASWSGDHRIIDGATIANFNKRWQQFLEEPMQMLTVMK
ncbi:MULTISPECIES: dihydrolipoyllysine-residue acetyltransferase [Gammaproteobacteria]|uniref:dihydrolipoyllysine-residue acetyltransferase n=1 Tax=Gammaproteobacteria TaxID=1236 RepID=UPI000DD0312F|nr:MULTISPECIES: dihydrolipoyllysine-residue acetyltransferase [Gammaproteobacteria]RTE87503.1 dihydrolipoyllysine-residue acetyltransferase [Aliidiomarina sp. B3213]TCZ92712.1 dihydrolipoyllysine-residue acetyltransferase [Lysobacter sp. N42]